MDDGRWTMGDGLVVVDEAGEWGEAPLLTLFGDFFLDLFGGGVVAEVMNANPLMACILGGIFGGAHHRDERNFGKFSQLGGEGFGF